MIRLLRHEDCWHSQHTISQAPQHPIRALIGGGAQAMVRAIHFNEQPDCVNDPVPVEINGHDSPKSSR